MFEMYFFTELVSTELSRITRRDWCPFFEKPNSVKSLEWLTKRIIPGKGFKREKTLDPLQLLQSLSLLVQDGHLVLGTWLLHLPNTWGTLSTFEFPVIITLVNKEIFLLLHSYLWELFCYFLYSCVLSVFIHDFHRIVREAPDKKLFHHFLFSLYATSNSISSFIPSVEFM